MGPQEDKEFPFALMEITPVPASAPAESAPLPDVVKSNPAPSAPECCNTAENEAPTSETHLSIGAQVVAPFIIAGMGMVGAGFYLDHVQVNHLYQYSNKMLYLRNLLN